MVTMDQAQQLLGARVVDADGDKVGTVNEVYLDDVTGEPSWVTVTTGWFGLSESFVPLDRARISGDLIRVPFDKATIKAAPRYDGGEPLSPRDEDELYRHYRIAPGTSRAARGADTDTDNAGHTDIPDGGGVPDESLIRWEEQSSVRPGSNPQESVTRFEDQRTVGTERMRTGRARLRKYVVTEQRTVTVPVSHEEARIERVPITNPVRDHASPGAELTAEEYAIVLHGERPVVTIESVPVERVRLDTGTVTSKKLVTGDVRKGQVDLADDEPPQTREDDPVTFKSKMFGGRRPHGFRSIGPMAHQDPTGSDENR